MFFQDDENGWSPSGATGNIESPFLREDYFGEEGEPGQLPAGVQTPFARVFKEAAPQREPEYFEETEPEAFEGAWEAEKPEELEKKLKFLAFFPHTVEQKGSSVALTPGVMDPGIYDGPVKFKVAPRLQECLMNVIKNNSRFAQLKIALVDLTKGENQPELAAYNHKSQVFAASVPKIAAMLGALQLRQDLRAALKQKKAASLDQLYDLVRDDWAAAQKPDPADKATPFTKNIALRGKQVLAGGKPLGLKDPRSPQLETVFAKTPAGSTPAVEFSSTGEDYDQLKAIIEDFNKEKPGSKAKLDALGFLERLRVMAGGLVPASNYATFTIVRDVGYPYIASTLLQSGLYDTNRNGGLWLGSDYARTVWMGAPGGGVPQSATAGSLAAFMTLLFQNRLVSAQASEIMQNLIKKEPNLTHPGIQSWFREGIHRLPDKGLIKRAYSKVGIFKGHHDCALIERKVIAGGVEKTIKYIAVGLGAQTAAQLKDLALELDKCILTNNDLTPAQGGHPETELEEPPAPLAWEDRPAEPVQRFDQDAYLDQLTEEYDGPRLEVVEEEGEAEGWGETDFEDQAGQGADLSQEYILTALEEAEESEALDEATAEWEWAEEAEGEELFEREDWEPQKEKIKVKVNDKEELVEKVIFEKAVLTSADKDERIAIKVNAFRFKGVSEKVALIFAGVHGSEPQGVVVAKLIFEALKKAARGGKKPKFTTIIIPELFTARRSSNPRYVLFDGSEIEPNRNFPRPGEDYATAKKRGETRADHAELLDACGRPLVGRLLTHRMLAENRILVQLIEREKPERATSIHAHSSPGRRGDGPGIFVDPRGDFNECSDVSKTAEGKNDDTFTADLIKDALSKLSLPLKNDAGKTLDHPLHGNFADHFTNKIGSSPSLTVHYTSTAHPLGTSFGMWAPARGITTITMELPQYKSASKALKTLSGVYAQVLIDKFLGGLTGP